MRVAPRSAKSKHAAASRPPPAQARRPHAAAASAGDACAASTRPPARAAAATRGVRAWRTLRQLGPGLVTGASDDDPSGIGTYSQVGAQFGLAMLWTLLFSYPLMVAAQLVSARIGRVTGRGIAGNLRRHFPAWLLHPLVWALVVANTVNIGADLGAMGEAMKLVLGGPAHAWTVLLGALSLVLVVCMPYRRYVHVLKWLCLAVLAYVATAFAVRVPWGEVLHATLVPQISSSRDYLTGLVAVLGTTISPYLFFWQASQEVEEMKSGTPEKPLKQEPDRAPRQLERIGVDTWFGMGVSNVIAFFIILTTAATLHAHGVHDVDSATRAADALRPVAGDLAFGLFALGIVGTGLLAVPVLASSAAYGVGEAMAWRTGLERKPRQARAFYAAIAAATLLGIALNFTHVNPVRALYWSAVINGALAAPILAVIMLVAARRDVMGEFVIGTPLKLAGWLTTATMAACLAALLATAGA
jgi:NRAMP (natural resistance-associated macrophage protein)-like metal ion transporter